MKGVIANQTQATSFAVVGCTTKGPIGPKKQVIIVRGIFY